MKTAEGLEAQAASLADLFEKKLKIRGDGLEAKLRKGRRRLPRWVRREAGRFVEAQRLASHPKLAMRTDAAGLDAAYARCSRWAKGVDLSKQRKDAALRLLAVNAMNLLLVGAAFVAYLAWSGNL